MANPSGRAGRDGEHKTNSYLAAAGFRDVEREGKRAASLDNVAVDLTVPVETKRRATLAIPEWTRKVESVHGEEWALFVIQRDARKKLHPDLMVVPAQMGADMLYLREQIGDPQDIEVGFWCEYEGAYFTVPYDDEYGHFGYPCMDDMGNPGIHVRAVVKIGREP